jgi:hypothetical protein
LPADLTGAPRLPVDLVLLRLACSADSVARRIYILAGILHKLSEVGSAIKLDELVVAAGYARFSEAEILHLIHPAISVLASLSDRECRVLLTAAENERRLTTGEALLA